MTFVCKKKVVWKAPTHWIHPSIHGGLMVTVHNISSSCENYFLLPLKCGQAIFTGNRRDATVFRPSFTNVPSTFSDSLKHPPNFKNGDSQTWAGLLVTIPSNMPNIKINWTFVKVLFAFLYFGVVFLEVYKSVHVLWMYLTCLQPLQYLVTLTLLIMGVSNLTCIKIIFVKNMIWKCMYGPCH